MTTTHDIVAKLWGLCHVLRQGDRKVVDRGSGV